MVGMAGRRERARESLVLVSPTERNCPLQGTVRLMGRYHGIGLPPTHTYIHTHTPVMTILETPLLCFEYGSKGEV